MDEIKRSKRVGMMEFRESEELQAAFIAWKQRDDTQMVLDVLRDLFLHNTRKETPRGMNSGVATEASALDAMRNAGFADCLVLLESLVEAIRYHEDMPEETYN